MGNQAYKKRHKEQGLCVDCSRLAILGETRCATHNYNINMQNKRSYYKYHGIRLVKNEIRRQRYIEEGRCPICSAPLDPKVDEGHVDCINCRMYIHKPQGVYYEITNKSID